MLSIRFSTIIFLSFATIMLLGENLAMASSKGAERLYGQAAEVYRRIYREAPFRKSEDNWLKAILNFEKITRLYPNHEKSKDSLYNLGKLYGDLYKLNRKPVYLAKSTQAFQQLADSFPKHRLADDAVFYSAKNFELLYLNTIRAIKEYRGLISRFPNSEWKNKAKIRSRILMQRRYKAITKNFFLLYRDTPFRKLEQNWLKTINEFRELYENFPDDFFAKKSLFNNGKLYISLYRWNYKNVYLEESNKLFRTFAQRYPNDRLADDALFFLAENYELYKKDTNQAYLEYRNIVENFPNGDKEREARKKMALLYKAPQKDLKGMMKSIKELPPTSKNYLTTRFGGLDEIEAKKKPPTKVLKVEYWSTSEWTRFVILTGDEIRFEYQSLKSDPAGLKKERLYLDLNNAFLPQGFKKKIAIGDGIVDQARIAQFNKHTVRMVLDLDHLRRFKVYNFKKLDENRIIIDVFGDNFSTQTLESRTEKKSRYAKGKSNNEHIVRKGKYEGNKNTVTLATALGLGVNDIVLDPGHGGRDPGAVSMGLREKDITLKLALKLKKIFEKRSPGIAVSMTRTKDIYLSLEARTAMANKHKGDLFVSIHVNASTNPRLSGVETYFLNLTTDQEALRLAALENQSTLRSIGNLQNILEDLMATAKIQESSELADTVQQTVWTNINNNLSRGNRNIRNLGVKQAPFMVLIGSEMPSILIEAGFLTNKKENQRLKTNRHLELLAESIYSGLMNYIQQPLAFKYP